MQPLGLGDPLPPKTAFLQRLRHIFEEHQTAYEWEASDNLARLQAELARHKDLLAQDGLLDEMARALIQVFDAAPEAVFHADLMLPPPPAFSFKFPPPFPIHIQIRKMQRVVAKRMTLCSQLFQMLAAQSTHTPMNLLLHSLYGLWALQNWLTPNMPDLELSLRTAVCLGSVAKNTALYTSYTKAAELSQEIPWGTVDVCDHLNLTHQPQTAVKLLQVFYAVPCCAILVLPSAIEIMENTLAKVAVDSLLLATSAFSEMTLFCNAIAAVLDSIIAAADTFTVPYAALRIDSKPPQNPPTAANAPNPSNCRANSRDLSRIKSASLEMLDYTINMVTFERLCSCLKSLFGKLDQADLNRLCAQPTDPLHPQQSHVFLDSVISTAKSAFLCLHRWIYIVYSMQPDPQTALRYTETVDLGCDVAMTVELAAHTAYRFKNNFSSVCRFDSTVLLAKKFLHIPTLVRVASYNAQRLPRDPDDPKVDSALAQPRSHQAWTPAALAAPSEQPVTDSPSPQTPHAPLHLQPDETHLDWTRLQDLMMSSEQIFNGVIDFTNRNPCHILPMACSLDIPTLEKCFRSSLASNTLKSKVLERFMFEAAKLHGWNKTLVKGHVNCNSSPVFYIDDSPNATSEETFNLEPTNQHLASAFANYFTHISEEAQQKCLAFGTDPALPFDAASVYNHSALAFLWGMAVVDQMPTSSLAQKINQELPSHLKFAPNYVLCDLEFDYTLKLLQLQCARQKPEFRPATPSTVFLAAIHAAFQLTNEAKTDLIHLLTKLLPNMILTGLAKRPTVQEYWKLTLSLDCQNLINLANHIEEGIAGPRLIDPQKNLTNTLEIIDIKCAMNLCLAAKNVQKLQMAAFRGSADCQPSFSLLDCIPSANQTPIVLSDFSKLEIAINYILSHCLSAKDAQGYVAIEFS